MRNINARVAKVKDVMMGRVGNVREVANATLSSHKDCVSLRPFEIEKYCRVPARMDSRRIRRGANNEFMNENAIPEKKSNNELVNENCIPARRRRDFFLKTSWSNT